MSILRRFEGFCNRKSQNEIFHSDHPKYCLLGYFQVKKIFWAFSFSNYFWYFDFFKKKINVKNQIFSRKEILFSEQQCKSETFLSSSVMKGRKKQNLPKKGEFMLHGKYIVLFWNFIFIQIRRETMFLDKKNIENNSKSYNISVQQHWSLVFQSEHFFSLKKTAFSIKFCPMGKFLNKSSRWPLTQIKISECSSRIFKEPYTRSEGQILMLGKCWILSSL